MTGQTVIRFGPFAFRLPQGVLEARGRTIPLGSRATSILAALLKEPGELVSREELVLAVWSGAAIEDSAVRVHMSKLRRALASEDSKNDYIANVAGRGYRFVSAVRIETEEPSSRTPPRPILRGLPTHLKRIHGRSKTIDELTEELSGHRFLTISGPGGIGKTTVALAVADRFEMQGGDVCFVDFASVATRELVISTVAVAAGVAVADSDPIPEILANLSQGNVLIVLDNCEHLVEVVADLAERLLQRTRMLRVLVTSREPLRAEGERVYQLSALPTPPSRMDLDPTEAAEFPSVRLFVEQAKAVRNEFELSSDNVEYVCDICRRLDGIPLALEFAAARSDVMDPASLALHLEDRFLLLTKNRRTALPRHKTLRAMMDWSYELLEPSAQAFLRCLSVFRSRFDISGARAIANSDDPNEYTTLEAVTDLCAKSLITSEQVQGRMHYRLLDTTRYYAMEKLEDSGNGDIIRRRHALYFHSILRDPEVALGSKEQQKFIAEHGRYIDDLRAAVDWAFSAAGDPVLGVRLVISAGFLWFHLSLTAEFARQGERAIGMLSDAKLTGTADEVALLFAFALAAYHSRWPVEASPAAFQRALHTARNLANKPLELRSLWGVWLNDTLDGSYAESLILARKFRDVAQSFEAQPGDLLTGNRMVTLSHHLMGDQKHALELLKTIPHQTFEPTLTNRVTFALVDGIVSILSLKSRVLWMSGFADQALAMARHCVDAALTGGHDATICPNFPFGPIPVAIWCGEFDLARELLAHLEHRSRRRGLQHWTAWAEGLASAINGDGTMPLGADLLQLETFATCGASSALNTLIRAGRHATRHWCQPELLRLYALSDEIHTQEDRRARLSQAYELAQHQGARAWQLRAATSLAVHDRLTDQADGGRKLLLETLASFKEGFSTYDLRYAAEIASR